MATNQQKSTRQQLEKIPNFPCLYRHKLNGTYYAVKKHAGKKKDRSLQTTDRKIAERTLAEWIKSLDKLDASQEKTTLVQLIEKFIAARLGLSESTRNTDASIIKRFKNDWKHGLDIRVSHVKPSYLNEWLASIETSLRNTSYNRYSGFLGDLFKIAVDDRMIDVSPFSSVNTKWKKPQKVRRFVPTSEQFQAIVNDIRAQRFNSHAKESADFVEFLGLAGLGQAEASALTWENVDWTRNVLHIKRQKTDELFQVPLYPDLKVLLERLKSEVPDASPKDRVFSISDAKKAIHSACKRLGYHPFTHRSFRCYLIGKLWKAKVDIKLISKWQGHQDGGKLIMNTYTEVFGTDDGEYVNSELAKVKWSSLQTPQLMPS